MLEIKAVAPGSIAEELELEAGDSLLSINGQVVRDILDFGIHEEQEELLLEVEKADGEIWDLELEKDAEDSLGLGFEELVPTQCGNNCIFCFVHQLPKGMRPTLYVKDEDFRYSYLYGSYVTLTNIDEEQIGRIIDQRLSPLYVSVHATEEQLRGRLIGRTGPPILELLRRLTEAGIEIHTQIVLCPGYNDGEDLVRSVADLHALAPAIRSLAVVPVGLTGYRQRLPDLRPPTESEAREVLVVLEEHQGRYLAESGSRFVFAADELYLKAKAEFPPLEDYEDLPQLENGVGMVPLFRSQGLEVLAEAVPLRPMEVSTFTGVSAEPELARFTAELSSKTGVAIHLHGIGNDFFGGQVSVTGLLTGRDILEQLKGRALGEALLLPDVVLKDEGDLFLDDLSLAEFESALGVPVHKIASSPWGLLDTIEILAA